MFFKLHAQLFVLLNQKNEISTLFKIFLVTGGWPSPFGPPDYSCTTEILKDINDKKWTVLKYGNLPGSTRYCGYRSGVSLATVGNNVFAFGNLNDNIMTFNELAILRWSIRQVIPLLNLQI